MKEEFYAHSRDGKPPKDWHRLDDHLKAVAEMAGTFAEDFRAGNWEYLACLWHDLGKYPREFQARLLAVNDPDAQSQTRRGCPYHSTIGAT